MGFSNSINKVARITNKWMMTVLALTIAVLLLSKILSELILGLWALFIVLSMIFSINGLLLNSSFNKEVNNFMKAGKPVSGIQGFDDLVEALKNSLIKSITITFASILSFTIYVVSLNDVSAVITDMGPTLALAMAFVAISVMFLVEYPEDPSFTPGGLIGFYEPDVFPFILDNLISDVFVTYMDPATFMRYDEWSFNILDLLQADFENDENQTTRLERAREKILILAYLNNTTPEGFTSEIVHKELEELFGPENLSSFIDGKGTGLTWEEIKDIIKRVEQNAPEPFRLVDRILVNLTDNYEQFTSQDLYFTISAKTNQGSVSESSGIIVYFINMKNESDRSVNVKLVTDELTKHPAKQEVTIGLDVMTDPFPEKQPPLVGEGEDILSILSSLLQVGDAVWFRIQPRGFGYRVISILAYELNSKKAFGKSFEMRFTKSISWYVKAYAPKLSALGSIALPIIKPLLPI